MRVCQLNKFNEDNHRDVVGDTHPQSAMQWKKSLERLHGNGDVPHSGWNERVSG